MSVHEHSHIEDNPHRGILFMLASVFLFSVMNVIAKDLSEHYPVMQVVFFRCFFALVPSLVTVAATGGVKLLRTRRFKGHVMRAAAGVVSMVSIFYAFHMMPLADATAINFSGPLFITLFAIFLLKEKVGPHRWAALIAGLVGVLVMVQPGQSGVNIGGSLMALTSALFYGLAMAGVRALGRTEKPATSVFYFSLLSTLITMLVVPFVWQAPRWQDFLMLVLGGVLAGLGQLFMTRALQLAPASVVSPFSYSAIIWATLFGWIFWDDVPGRSIFIGGAIVIAAGLYIVHREVVRHKGRQPPLPSFTSDQLP